MINKKAIYLFSLLFMALLTTSCLDDSGSEISVTFQPAVVKGASPNKLFMLKSGEYIYDESYQSNVNVEEGDCGLVDFVWNTAGSSAVADSIKFVASSLEFTELTKNPMKENLSDTAKVYSKEQAISSFYTKSVILEKNLFLFTEHARGFSNSSVDLSYNKGFVPVAGTDGKTVYNLYLRIIGDTTETKVKTIMYNVVDLSAFINEKGNKELEKKKDTLYFKVNYLSAVKTDSIPSWGTKDFAVYLPE